MAFEAFGLIVGRGDIFNIASDFSSAINIYKSPYDVLSEIIYPGYFPPYLGENKKTVLAGDILFIQDKNLVTKPCYITSVDPITLAAINPFDQSLNTTDSVNFNSLTATNTITIGGNIAGTVFFPAIHVSMTFNGCFFPPGAVVDVTLMKFTILGFKSFVSISVPPLFNTTTFGFAFTSTAVPIGYIPSFNASSMQLAQNVVGSVVVNVPVQMQVVTDGTLRVFGDLQTGNFQFGSGFSAGIGWQSPLNMIYEVSV